MMSVPWVDRDPSSVHAFQTRRGSESDAREAYEHMARCGIGASSATFYLHYAAFEEAYGQLFDARLVNLFSLPRAPGHPFFFINAYSFARNARNTTNRPD